MSAAETVSDEFIEDIAEIMRMLGQDPDEPIPCRGCVRRENLRTVAQTSWTIVLERLAPYRMNDFPPRPGDARFLFRWPNCARTAKAPR